MHEWFLKKKLADTTNIFFTSIPQSKVCAEVIHTNIIKLRLKCNNKLNKSFLKLTHWSSRRAADRTAQSAAASDWAYSLLRYFWYSFWRTSSRISSHLIDLAFFWRLSNFSRSVSLKPVLDIFCLWRLTRGQQNAKRAYLNAVASTNFVENFSWDRRSFNDVQWKYGSQDGRNKSGKSFRGFQVHNPHFYANLVTPLTRREGRSVRL